MSAYLSPDGVYRYWLARDTGSLEGAGSVVFVGLNPSTADATIDDPTIRRCVGFARRWHYAGLEMVNLYAYRATDPLELWAARRAGVDVVGPENDQAIAQTVAGAGLVIVAWGAPRMPGADERATAVLELLANARCIPHCLAVTADNLPRHPLYMRADTTPIPYHP